MFGLAHTLLVWAGDILLIYALSALVMVVLFRNTPARRLWKWALVFLVFPVVLMWLGTLSIMVAQTQPELQAEIMADFAADEQALREGVERAARIHAEGTLAGVFMALGYLSMIVLAAERLRFLAPAGQMALTNYLLQSIVWTWMIYGYGLGLWGELPRWSHIPLSLVFFVLQVLFSSWWLARFRFGPAEWLWRSLTYWQVQPMRR